MTTLSAKIADLFRSFKSDAVPRDAQTQRDVAQGIPAGQNVDVNSNTDGLGRHDEHAFIIHSDASSVWKKTKPKSKKAFFFTKTTEENDDYLVNTQAFITTSPQLNIVNCTDVTYYMPYSEPYPATTIGPERKMAEKCGEIAALMEAEVKPDHEYLDLIASNLGKNWHGFFNLLGYLKGYVETVEIDTREYGVTEARYKLLLDWVRNDEVGTLGCLAVKLWEHGDRQLVKQLAKIYLNKKNNK